MLTVSKNCFSGPPLEVIEPLSQTPLLESLFRNTPAPSDLRPNPNPYLMLRVFVFLEYIESALLFFFSKILFFLHPSLEFFF